jgi:YebC/PmpR family DNA-binding regulatory protein
MSGHSKWATTKHKKDAIDKKRSASFAKLSKNIILAAKKGGDPNMNFSLRLAVDKAKSLSMPKENIDRAIKRGTGELAGAVMEEMLYEGYGPHGVAMLIECVTDNKNRTTPDVRAMLTKKGGSIGSLNSVKWMFVHKGVIHLSNDQLTDKKDELILDLLDNGAEDVVEESGITIFATFENFEKVKKFLEEKKIIPEYAEVEWVAKDQVEIDDEAREKVLSLIDLLEENEDVNAVYSNLK